MSTARTFVVEPIVADDVPDVAAFLHLNLNSRLSPDQWQSAILQPWPSPLPNHGFQLRNEGLVQGVALCFYAQRELGGATRVLCNLAALCVLPESRQHAFRLIRAAIKQPGLEFTDLSPSGNVMELNSRLGFRSLDTTTYLTVNTPRPRGRVRILHRGGDIARVLAGPEADVFESHRRAGAAEHLVAVRGDRHCYVIFRRDRRKNLPLFASILYVSNLELYAEIAPHIGSHLFLRYRLPLTLSEVRITGHQPKHGWKLRRARPKMFKSSTLAESEIDYLYSELTCVPW